LPPASEFAQKRDLGHPLIVRRSLIFDKTKRFGEICGSCSNEQLLR
jgi:hypothetical protein